MGNEEVDITDILGKPAQGVTGSSFDSVLLSARDAPPTDEETVELADVLKKAQDWDVDTTDIPVDLSSLSFTANDEDMYLSFPVATPGYSKPLFFKADPDDSTNPKILHAQKQFCRMIGVPHGFFISNRPNLRAKIVETWQAGLVSADEEGKSCVVRVRDCTESGIIRAFIPVNAVPLKNTVLLDIVQKTLPDVRVDFVRGAEMDDLVLHGRFYFDQDFSCAGFSVSAGISLIASELGACPLQVEALLHINDTNMSFVASYGGDSYFKTKYAGIQHDEIVKMLPGMLRRIRDQLPVYIASVVARDVTDGSFLPKVECTKFNRSKGLPAKFKRALFHEVHDQEGDIDTPWDFARTIAAVAEGYDSMKRLSIERAVGKYLGLAYGKEARDGSEED